LNGMAILYADRRTDSMERAIGETERRRAKQQAFNALHGITPVGVKKQIKELIDGVYDPHEAKKGLQTAKDQALFDAMDERQIGKEIKRLEKLMIEFARNLEFEKAAKTRDQLAVLKEQIFGSNGNTNVVAFVENKAA
jgi:excinuclease ABC subunit B